MKKIFTLIAGLLMTVALFAADRSPVVTVKKAKEYKIVIDGTSYEDKDMSMRLTNISPGYHTIKVYEKKRGLFGGDKMVGSSSFTLNQADVVIRIDNSGKIDISENGRGFRNDRNRDNRDNRDWDERDSRDRKDREMRERRDRENRDRKDRENRDRDDRRYDKDDEDDDDDEDWKDKKDKKEKKYKKDKSGKWDDKKQKHENKQNRGRY